MSNDLTVRISSRGRVTIVEVAGEIDIASAPQLEHALARALTAGAEIVIDLAEVDFMDVSGLRALLGAERRADWDGIPLVLISVPRPVSRLLALTGADDVLTIEDFKRTQAPADRLRRAAQNSMQLGVGRLASGNTHIGLRGCGRRPPGETIMSGTLTDRRAPAAQGGCGDMHVALFYRDDREYLDGLMGFIEPALATGEPVAAALPPLRAELLRRRLTGAADRVRMLDMFELGRNPARIIPAVEMMLATHGGELLHYVGEPIWPGRTAEEIREATKHEALINLAWPGAKIRVLCPYDTASLPSAVLAGAECTHPRVIRDGVERASPAYDGPGVPTGCDQQLVPPPPDATRLRFGLESLAGVRLLVGERGGASGLSRERVEDLVVAINELAANAIRHGHGGGTLHVWNRPGRLICQVRDAGQIGDPLAGRRNPDPDVPGGVGLWMVNQLCDLVEVRSGEPGTTVRVHMVLA